MEGEHIKVFLKGGNHVEIKHAEIDEDSRVIRELSEAEGEYKKIIPFEGVSYIEFLR